MDNVSTANGNNDWAGGEPAERAMQDLCQRVREGRRIDWDRDATRGIIADLASQILSRPWPGRQGPTDRLVLLVMLRLSARYGKLVHYVDVRGMAAMAGISPPTVVKSYRRLRKAGWLVRIEMRRQQQDAITYLVSPLRAVSADRYMYNLLTPAHPGPGSTVAAAASQPAAGSGGVPEMGAEAGGVPEAGAGGVSDTDTHSVQLDELLRWAPTPLGVLLGPSVVWVALHLTGHPQTVSALARTAMVSRPAAHGALRNQLRLHGLAVQTPAGWVRGVPLAEYVLDPVPETVARRNARYEQERSAFYYRIGMRNAENNPRLRQDPEWQDEMEALRIMGKVKA